jgi:hypothetical protein
MASIWTQGPGMQPLKLEGNLMASPDIVRSKLLKWAESLQRRNKAKLALDEHFEIELMWPDGVRFRVWAEFFSPPSKPEAHEPRPAKVSKS